MRWVALGLVLSLLGVGVTGCGSGSGSSGGGSGSGNGGIVLTVKVDFTGGNPVTGTFKDTSFGSTSPTCADYATKSQPFGTGFITPDPTNGGKFGGKEVSIQATIPNKKFHGPGTYGGATFLGLKIGQDLYANGNDDPWTLVVKGDGSGSLAFSNAQGTAASDVESGTMTWTCASS